MLKMVDGTGIIGVDMICPLGVSTPQPPNYDRVELEGTGMLVLPNSLDAPLERLELIGNSVQGENPAPDNPQEIKSCGRKSKNLFDAKKAKSGWITTDGKQTLVTLGSTDNVVSDYIQVYPGMKYTSSARVFQNFYDSEKNFLNHNTTPSTSIVVPDNAKYMIVVIAVNKALAIQTANTLMINIGSSALPYEQYTDKYLLDVKVTGKNLLNLQKEPDVKGTYQGWKVGNGELLTLGVKDKGNNADIKGCYIGFSDQGSESNGVVWVVDNGVIKVNPRIERKTYVSIFPANKTAVKKLTDRFDIQCELGDVATPYQPYKEQTLTLTSDRPITKWDRLVEQGGEIGWLYQSAINEYRGDTAVAIYENGFYFLLNNKKLKSGEGYCEELKQYVIREEKPCINFNMSPNTYAYTLNTQAIYGSTTSAIKEYLKTHPLHLVYKTETTEFVPLPQSEQNAIRALKTYYPTTVITADGGELDPDIKVTYRKEI